MQGIGNGPQTARKLDRIRYPIAELAGIVRPIFEPAIINHNQFDPERLGLRNFGAYLGFTDIKVRGLPGVIFDQILPRQWHDVIGKKAVENMTEIIQAISRVRHRRFRGHKRFTRLQLPGKELRIQAHHQPTVAKLIDLRGVAKVTTPQQRHTQRLACKVIRCRCRQNRCRYALWTTGPIIAGDGLVTRGERLPGDAGFAEMGARQSNEIVSVIIKIQL